MFVIQFQLFCKLHWPQTCPVHTSTAFWSVLLNHSVYLLLFLSNSVRFWRRRGMRRPKSCQRLNKVKLLSTSFQFMSYEHHFVCKLLYLWTTWHLAFAHLGMTIYIYECVWGCVRTHSCLSDQCLPSYWKKWKSWRCNLRSSALVGKARRPSRWRSVPLSYISVVDDSEAWGK